MPRLGPRVVISGIGSGVGKTTVAAGIMAALRARGLDVASAKVGPDFIDPGYHTVATGRPGRSLDTWLSGEELLPSLAADATSGVDILVVEGVMGLFDGSGEPGCDGSTAAVARILEAPVVVVVDVWTMSTSVAALVQGFRDFDRHIDVAGVILNRVAGEGHATLCREALDGIGVPVLGVLANDDALAWRERHLGLVPVAEHPDEVARAVAQVGALVDASCDLARIVEIARRAPSHQVAPSPPAARSGCVRVAVASGPAFSFVYPENLRLLEQAGAELVRFDPLADRALPERTDALYVGGGFPEVFGPELAENRPLAASVRKAVDDGVVVWAECGGLLWLSRSLDGAAMAGVLPADAHMTDRLVIGYREAVCEEASPLAEPGTVLRGYEFHRTTLDPPGGALRMSSRFGSGVAGYASPRLFASYLHQHLSATPEIAERFVAAAARANG